MLRPGLGHKKQYVPGQHPYRNAGSLPHIVLRGRAFPLEEGQPEDITSGLKGLHLWGQPQIAADENVAGFTLVPQSGHHLQHHDVGWHHLEWRYLRACYFNHSSTGQGPSEVSKEDLGR